MSLHHKKSTMTCIPSSYVLPITQAHWIGLCIRAKNQESVEPSQDSFVGFWLAQTLALTPNGLVWSRTKIADKISRLKKLTPTDSKSPPSHDTYDYANLQQEHKELRACNSFQPSHKLVSLLSEILLTGYCPDLKQILKLKPQDLGKLCIWTLRTSIAFKILAAASRDTRGSSRVSWSNSCLITTPDLQRSADTSNPSTLCSNFVALTLLPTYRTALTCVPR